LSLHFGFKKLNLEVTLPTFYLGFSKAIEYVGTCVYSIVFSFEAIWARISKVTSKLFQKILVISSFKNLYTPDLFWILIGKKYVFSTIIWRFGFVLTGPAGCSGHSSSCQCQSAACLAADSSPIGQ
jgi:hypothetical protein